MLASSKSSRRAPILNCSSSLISALNLEAKVREIEERNREKGEKKEKYRVLLVVSLFLQRGSWSEVSKTPPERECELGKKKKSMIIIIK